jgi:hypothetical protein
MRPSSRGKPFSTYRIESLRAVANANLVLPLASVTSFTGASVAFTLASDLALSSIGSPDSLNAAELTLSKISVSSTGGAIAELSAPSLLITSTGTFQQSATANLTLPSLSVTSNGTRIYEATAALNLNPLLLTAATGAKAEFSVQKLQLTATGSKQQTAVLQASVQGIRLSSTGVKEESASAELLLPTLSFPFSAANLRLSTLKLESTGSISVTNSVGYVMNVRTTESTTYSNYPFMHIITIGGLPYGITSDGLYLLKGDKDTVSVSNITEINAAITTKETDFGQYNGKRVPKMYLNTDTMTRITPFVDGKSSLSYQSIFTGRKASLGRGLEGRYWRFKVENIKKLEGLEFLPEVIQRRVK